MANYPTLKLKFSQNSQYSQEPDLLISEFGDGFIHRVANGINNVDKKYQINQTTVNSTEGNTLRSFLLNNSAGEAVTVPLYNIDPSGSTTADFYILNWDETRRQGTDIIDWQIEMRQLS